MTLIGQPRREAPERGHLTVRGHTVTLVPPNPRDPRFKVSAVILTVQVLGQTVLGFKVSVAQILISMAFCALVEALVTLYRDNVLAWPASAVLTGSGVALILRASGTRHGDWWSLHGIQYFLLAAALSLASKYFIRAGGRHLFNPSNVGIVWCLLVIGPARVFPQYLWWGPIGAPVLVATAVIVVGGIWVLRAVRMVPLAATFLSVYVALIGLAALAGHSLSATWHNGPVGGASFFLDICTSPELLVFVFFMISDPQTAPRASREQIRFGAITALVAGGLAFFEPTEFGIKIALLASLTVSCALRPVIEQRKARYGWRSIARGIRNPVVIAVLIIGIAAPVDTAALAGNHQLVEIERRLTGAKNPQ